MQKILSIPLMLILIGCHDNSNSTESFPDQSEFLTHYADQFIVPAIKNSSLQIDHLSTTWQAYKEKSNDLDQLKKQLYASTKAWLMASPYSFGPAAQQGITPMAFEDISTFPVDTTRLNEFIQQGLTTHPKYVQLKYLSGNFKGLYALEYLIHNKALDQPHTIQLVDSLLHHTKKKINQIDSQWKASYRSNFISNTGTSIGSSINTLYNAWVIHYEAIKYNKVARPYNINPSYVESYYAAKSLEYIRMSLDLSRKLFNGGDTPDSKHSLRKYLSKVEGGKELIQTMDTKWQEIDTDLKALEKTGLSWQKLLKEQNSKTKPFVQKLLRYTRYVKSEMARVIGFSITFTSNDGD